jgi:hypothetical protein
VLELSVPATGGGRFLSSENFAAAGDSGIPDSAEAVQLSGKYVASISFSG